MSDLTTYTELADILDRLPSIVRDTRRAQGLSLREVCEELGCANSTLLRIERGDGFTVVNAVQILRWLDRTAGSDS